MRRRRKFKAGDWSFRDCQDLSKGHERELLALNQQIKTNQNFQPTRHASHSSCEFMAAKLLREPGEGCDAEDAANASSRKPNFRMSQVS